MVPAYRAYPGLLRVEFPGVQITYRRVTTAIYFLYGMADKPVWEEPEYPTFNNDDILIIEDSGEIIGHRGLHFRNAVLRGDSSVLTVSSGDTAIHPLHRGSGLDSELHETALQMAKTRGAVLAFAWHLKDSASYNRNIKSNFIEVKQTPVYARIIKPEKVLKAGLLHLIHRRAKLRQVLAKLKEMYITIGKTRLSLAELAGEKPADSQKTIEVILKESSLSLLVNFRSWGKWRRVLTLVLLIITGKARLRTTSPGALVKLFIRGIEVLAAL
ncbi:hypothetical protein ES708_05875 [subsurface metagenome]